MQSFLNLSIYLCFRNGYYLSLLITISKIKLSIAIPLYILHMEMEKNFFLAAIAAIASFSIFFSCRINNSAKLLALESKMGIIQHFMV